MTAITNSINITLTVMLPIFAVVGVAALLGRWFPLDVRTLSRVIVYLFAPALIFQNIIEADILPGQLWSYTLMAVITSVILLVIGWCIARTLHFERKLSSGFLLSILISNAGFMGFPVVEYRFGTQGLQYAVIFFAISNTITNIVGIFISSMSGLSVRQALKNILLVPYVITAMLALLLNHFGISPPSPVMRGISILGQATIPCALVLLGLQLAGSKVGNRPGTIALASAIRLLAAPVLAFLVAGWLGITGLPADVIITQLSMPTAIFAAVIAIEFGSDAEFVSSSVLVTTLASIVTLSILLGIFL